LQSTTDNRASYPSLTVADPREHVVTLAVENPKRLETLTVGDTVDGCDVLRVMLVSVSRPRK